MNIIEKLTHISSELKALQKTGWNDFHKYNFVEIEDIIKAVNEHLVKHNIRYRVQIIETHFSDVFKDIAILAKAIFEDSKGNTFETDIFVNSADKSDKAGRKVMQMIKKQAFLDTFLITIGEKDADSESPETVATPPRKPKSKWNTVSTKSELEKLAANWDGTITKETETGRGIQANKLLYWLTPDQFQTLGDLFLANEESKK